MKRLTVLWQRARAALTAAADEYGRQLTDEDREHIAWAESLKDPTTTRTRPEADHG